MVKLKRFIANPILKPNPQQLWQAEAAFNGTLIQDGKNYHLLYRAQSKPQKIQNKTLELSTIGHAVSSDRVSFENTKQLITPQEDWETFGCEDPRVTKINDTYYIFYTALSLFPPEAKGIKVAVALSKNLRIISDRHLVTPFNAKAMALFPETVDGKLTAVLTVHTDMPPAKICVVQFEKLEDIWSPDFWTSWYENLDTHTLSLLRYPHDHIEVGAIPIKTSSGWLMIYSYIQNYTTSNRIFGIEAALLDLNNPQKILGRTEGPLLTPEASYEQAGKVPHVIFPTSALLNNNDLGIYYGAADTSVCLGTINLGELLTELTTKKTHTVFHEVSTVKRFTGNPIISPILEHTWEDQLTFNAAAIYLNNKVHILYRAMGKQDTSVLGYAASYDGVHIDERLNVPVYLPRAEFEHKGCEDPRITRLGDTLYMCYTAYDGKNPARVAFTSISVADFIAHKWNWSLPKLISPPDLFDKNACIFPEKIDGRYVFFHRLHHHIWIDFLDNLEFGQGKWLQGQSILSPKPQTWFSEKIGIGPPPIKTASGWLLICHGLSKEDNRYRLGAVLLNLQNPAQVEAFLPDPILSPHVEYENNGLRPGTVFSCGAVVMNNDLLLYYGAADQFVCVASIKLAELLKNLMHFKTHNL